VSADAAAADQPAPQLSEWQLAAAFSATASVSSISKELSHSRRDVRNAISAAALAWVKLQEKLLDDVLLETEGKTIELFYDKMVWDETKQTVTLNFSDLLSRDASRAAWNVMICRRYLGWQVAGEKLQELHLAMPPVILVCRLCECGCFLRLVVQPTLEPPSGAFQQDYACARCRRHVHQGGGRRCQECSLDGF
jgi:hypothetical protein